MRPRSSRGACSRPLFFFEWSPFETKSKMPGARDLPARSGHSSTTIELALSDRWRPFLNHLGQRGVELRHLIPRADRHADVLSGCGPSRGRAHSTPRQPIALLEGPEHNDILVLPDELRGVVFRPGKV